MPVYEFACHTCGREFTLVLFHPRLRAERLHLPTLQSKAIERLVTTCEVITEQAVTRQRRPRAGDRVYLN